MPITLGRRRSVGPIRVSYLQPASGSSSVTANVTTIADINLNNNKVTVVIGGRRDRQIERHVKFPPSINAGQTVSGTLTFANGGPSAAVGVRFSVTLPAHLGVLRH